MNRREFVVGASAAGMWGAGMCGVEAGAQGAAEAIGIVKPEEVRLVPEDFTGLSYEAGQLYNPRFFAAENGALVEAFRGLTPKGVLRIGGHLSNITPWKGVGQDEPRQVRGVRHGIEDYWEWPLVDPTVQANKRGMITRAALRNLRGFLDAVDWRLMYGLNFASGSAARAADEAAAVMEIAGPRLLCFVIGNEPDGFADDPVFRDKSYGVEAFIAEWKAWVKAIRAGVPGARFGGPDTDGKVETWVEPFARATLGEVALLTSHYYGMGPASAPGMTAERLLRKDPPELAKDIAGLHAAQAAAGGVPYRMDEGNSCFGGGKAGVSDAYAAALWAADFMLRAACAGFVGVNLHGGGVGVYTPVESSAKTGAGPRPVYFGMQMAQMFAGSRVGRCGLRTERNVSAYEGRRAGKSLLAVINKGAETVRVELPEEFGRARGGRRWELTGPGLGAKSGVRFGVVEGSGGEVGMGQVAGYSGVVLEV